MTQPKTNRIPAPLYAAAGAGELAFQQLRKLPAVVTDLGNKVVTDGTRVVTVLGGRAVVTGVELRQKADETLRTATLSAGTLREKAPADLAKLREAADLKRLRETADLEKLREATDLDRLRGLATRNAAVVVAGAQVAQERALAAYAALVARGERVVGAGVLEAADTVNADIEATETAVTTPATAAVTTPAVGVEDKAAVTTPAVGVEDRATAEVPTPADIAEVVEAKPAAAKKRATKAATKSADTPSAKLPRATKRTRPAAE
ncbi:hypothetical protein [Micromonospora endolithica]|uniref:Uncharacterized protein n=1 Tax=Micromonospora endolithica TaxID=230091 RepID=A0A3A9YUB7_9ACTN|nr:hypothetical protein [Micromonospora endolithica]RKN39114.1 hypothetical protein D7223_29615 [Micromonospora endolithica]TWJ25616.1 hypothetical protein JD76_05789 [Micromonospora endolithica]